MNLHGGLSVGEVKDCLAAADHGGEAAGVRDVVGGGEGDVGPVLVLLSTATVELQWNEINTSSRVRRPQ